MPLQTVVTLPKLVNWIDWKFWIWLFFCLWNIIYRLERRWNCPVSTARITKGINTDRHVPTVHDYLTQDWIPLTGKNTWILMPAWYQAQRLQLPVASPLCTRHRRLWKDGNWRHLHANESWSTSAKKTSLPSLLSIWCLQRHSDFLML